jgi:acyl-CoA synthetase (AMP-forming)/AMP-acid ligase II
VIGRRLERRAPQGLDLSSWRYAWVGAEPIFDEHLRIFARSLASSGLAPTVLRPCYGLAEATLAVTLPAPGVERTLTPRAEATSPRPDDRGEMLVGLGHVLDNLEVRIRSREQPHADLTDGTEGTIWIRGASVTEWSLGDSRSRDPEEWLDTGDLGLIQGGELYVTGRTKDLIIRGGVNFHPQDLERAAETVNGVRSGRSAAFSLLDHGLRKESVVVVVEAGKAADAQRIRSDVTAAVAKLVGIGADLVEVMPPGRVPKTTSGKIQRSLCRDLLVRGELRSGLQSNDDE